jgi:hypothetical protein
VRRVFGVIHNWVSMRGVWRDNEYEARGSTRHMRDWHNATLLETYVGRRETQQCPSFKYVCACFIRKIILKNGTVLNVITRS